MWQHSAVLLLPPQPGQLWSLLFQRLHMIGNECSRIVMQYADLQVVSWPSWRCCQLKLIAREGSLNLATGIWYRPWSAYNILLFMECKSPFHVSAAVVASYILLAISHPTVTMLGKEAGLKLREKDTFVLARISVGSLRFAPLDRTLQSDFSGTNAKSSM